MSKKPIDSISAVENEVRKILASLPARTTSALWSEWHVPGGLNVEKKIEQIRQAAENLGDRNGGDEQAIFERKFKKWWSLLNADEREVARRQYGISVVARLTLIGTHAAKQCCSAGRIQTIKAASSSEWLWRRWLYVLAARMPPSL